MKTETKKQTNRPAFYRGIDVKEHDMKSLLLNFLLAPANPTTQVKSIMVAFWKGDVDVLYIKFREVNVVAIAPSPAQTYYIWATRGLKERWKSIVQLPGYAYAS